MNLQGWYCHYRQHQPTLFQLAQLGVHRPDQQALRFYCLLLSSHHSKPLLANSTSPVPLLQGWSSRLSCNCQSPHQVSLQVNPFPIAPAPERQHQPHLRSSPPAGPSTSVSNTRCPLPVSCQTSRLCRSLQGHAAYRSLGICRSLPIIVHVRHPSSTFSA